MKSDIKYKGPECLGKEALTPPSSKVRNPSCQRGWTGDIQHWHVWKKLSGILKPIWACDRYTTRRV